MTEPVPQSRSQVAPESRSEIVLSAVMIAKDAAVTIGPALRSAGFCNEIIVVVDAASADETESIARRLATRVEVRPWEGFGRAKQAAVAMARGSWVLLLDADELVTPELAESIRAVTQRSNEPVACRLRRRTRFLGRWMRYGDWGRDRVTRLFRAGEALVTEDAVHESVVAPGRKPVLDGWLLHEGDQTIDTYLVRLNRYTTLAAQSLYDQGLRSGWSHMLFRPAFKFLQAYIVRAGFLDGWHGVVLAWYSAVYVFTKYAKLRRLE